MKNTYVLYHKNCLDGFGAALAAYTVLGEKAIYLPVTHQCEPPSLTPHSVLYIVDFAYNRPTMEQLLSTHEQVTVLDHHKTAAEELLGIKGALFDLNRSGAMITWEYFHPNAPIPRLFQYLQDRDLWRWQYEQTKAITAALFTIGFESFSDWLPYLNDDKLDELYTMGQIILKANTTIVKKQVSQSYFGFLPQNNTEIPLVNTPILVSETCHALLEDERYADYPFVAAWFVGNTNQVNYSLRSRSNFDCSQIAKQYGGGGHPQASGFSCPSFPTRKQ